MAMVYQLSLVCIGQRHIWLDRRGDKIVLKGASPCLKRAPWISIAPTLGLKKKHRAAILGALGEGGSFAVLDSSAQVQDHLIVIVEVNKREEKKRLIARGILRQDILDIPAGGRSSLVEVSLSGGARYNRRRSKASAMTLGEEGTVHLQLCGCAYSIGAKSGELLLRRSVSLIKEEAALAAA